MKTTNYIQARITPGRMGSFLLPPGHPGYDFEIEMDLKRNKENRGAMSLEYALEQDYISPELKNEIMILFNKWEENKLPLTDPLVIEWINDTTRHMGKQRAIKYIKKYYPDFK